MQNHQCLRGPCRRSLASGAFPLPMPWLLAKDTLTAVLPPVPLCLHRIHQVHLQGYTLYGYPWTLWSARTRLVQKGQPSSWWSLSRQSHYNHLSLLHISLGASSLFSHIPIIENQISQLEQIIHWSLRTSSCFLNFVPDVWGRLGYDMHSQKGSS